MFKRKKELQRKQAIIDSLKAENARLRVQLSDNRKETDEAIEAKEAERLELCDELGHAQDMVKVLTAKNERLMNGLKSANRENRLLIRTNANLAARLNVKPVKSTLRHKENN